MSFSEHEYVKGKQTRDPIRPFLPVIGLFMIVALGAIAFVLSTPVHELLMDQISDFPEEQEVQYVVGVVIFLLLVLVMSLIYAAFAPKPARTVSEKELKQEKAAIERERLAKKRRRRQMRKQMYEDREKRRQG